MNRQAPIVAGVDGSHSGLAAARYAAAMAQRRHAPLHLIQAYLTPLSGRGVSGGFDPYVVLNKSPEFEPDAELQLTTDLIHKEFPDLVEVQAWQAHGPPAHTLIERSRTAGVTVVGARGVGGFTELLLGSVASQVAAHGHGTIIVVRPPTPDRIVERGPEQPAPPAPPLGPVLVGVDGSPVARTAQRFAAVEAASRQVPLIIANVYWLDETWSLRRIDGMDPTVHAAQTAEQLVTEAARQMAVAHPDLIIEQQTIHSMNPEFSLIEASHDAALVVVGSRGRGGFTGLLLGSVGRSLVHHAHCPVAIVHNSLMAPDDQAGP
jgi:nucleotide-binding universal stress UspA family protein